MSVSINTFRNVRARITRNKTGEKIAGWVTHLSREEARIWLWSDLRFGANETLVGECFGSGTLARFNGKVVAQADVEIAIDLVGSISYAPSYETPRIFAAGISGQLTGEGTTARMRVLDVSPSSLGVVVEHDFETGQGLNMTLNTEMGPINARVTIANCRQDPDSPGCYRMGMHIVDLARLDKARWSRLIADRAGA